MLFYNGNLCDKPIESPNSEGSKAHFSILVLRIMAWILVFPGRVRNTDPCERN